MPICGMFVLQDFVNSLKKPTIMFIVPAVCLYPLVPHMEALRFEPTPVPVAWASENKSYMGRDSPLASARDYLREISARSRLTVRLQTASS